MTWYARSAGKNMGWLRHVLTLLSVVIFVSFDIFNVIIIFMKLLFCNWTLYFSHMLSSAGHFTAIICFYDHPGLWENEEVWREIIIFPFSFTTIYILYFNEGYSGKIECYQDSIIFLDSIHSKNCFALETYFLIGKMGCNIIPLRISHT